MSKNQLQEMAQRHAVQLPRYQTRQVGSSEHTHLNHYVSTVAYTDWHRVEHQVTSDPISNKKDAEKDAASKMIAMLVRDTAQEGKAASPVVARRAVNRSALFHVFDDDDRQLDRDIERCVEQRGNSNGFSGSGATSVSSVTVTLAATVLVMVDLDNLPSAVKELAPVCQAARVRVDVEVYYCRAATAKHAADMDRSPTFRLTRMESTRRDAVDMFMAMQLGRFSAAPTAVAVVILTRDHAGSAMEDCSRQLEKAREFRTFHACSVDEAQIVIENVQDELGLNDVRMPQ